MSREVKQEGIKRERDRRERSATLVNDRDDDDNNGDDDEVSFVRAAKRQRLPPIIINEDGVEILDLT